MADMQHPDASQMESSSAKRSSSTIGLPGPPQKRPVKRRASKACQSCRFRKVRCNVVEHGAPCTNCRLDEVECVLTESKRKRYFGSHQWSRKALMEVDRKSFSQYDDACTSHKKASARPAQKSAHGLDCMPHLSKSNSFSTDYRSSLSSHVPHYLYRNLAAPSSFPAHQEVRATQSDPGPESYGTDDYRRVSLSPINQGSYTTLSVPSYLKPIPTRLGPQEREFLHQKGALLIPDEELRDKLIVAFLEFVYPLYPVIDVRDFLSKINQGDSSSGRYSMLLFQAIMFAGSAYVDLGALEKAGFSSRQDARSKLYYRTRQLYDLDYEMDRFTQIQALILLTAWYESPEDRKDAWHWMGIVATMAYTIGMHRDPVQQHIDLRQVRLWKRVWWCAVMRDRVLALGVRRPMHIKLYDCDVPLLTVQDFEYETFPEAIKPESCTLLRDIGLQRTLAEMCIHATRLCVCIGDAVITQYSVQASRGLPLSYDMELLLGQQIDPNLASIDICTAGLQAWKEALPESLSLNIHRDIDTLRNSPRSTVSLRYLIQMLYHTTIGALHRPEVLPTVNTSNMPRDAELIQDSRVQLQEAASATGVIAKALLDLDYVRFLPTTGVTIFQTAIISLLLDIKSPDDSERQRALRGFCYCIQAMSLMRECYASAGHIIALVEAAIRRADIRVSLRKAEIRSPSSPAISQSSEKKASSAADLLAAAMYEGLIPPMCLSPLLVPVPPVTTMYLGPLGSEAEAAAKGRPQSQMTNAPTFAPQALMTSDIAKRMESFLTSPLPGPEQSGSDYWSFIASSETGDVAGADNTSANTMNGLASYGFDFDAYMNYNFTSGDGFREQEQQHQQQNENENMLLESTFDGSDDGNGLNVYDNVSPGLIGDDRQHRMMEIAVAS